MTITCYSLMNEWHTPFPLHDRHDLASRVSSSPPPTRPFLGEHQLSVWSAGCRGVIQRGAHAPLDEVGGGKCQCPRLPTRACLWRQGRPSCGTKVCHTDAGLRPAGLLCIPLLPLGFQLTAHSEDVVIAGPGATPRVPQTTLKNQLRVIRLHLQGQEACQTWSML